MTPDERIANYTWFLAVVAGLQFIALGLQCFVMYIQSKRLKETVEATEKAADAAKKSADILLEIEKAHLVVTVNNGKAIEFGTDVADVSVWNNGRTPATIIKFRSILSGNEDFPDMEGSDILMGTELGRNEKIIIHLPITQSQVIGVSRGTINIFCHTLIEYDDIFQHRNPKRNTWEYKFDISHPDESWVICGNKKLNHHT